MTRYAFALSLLLQVAACSPAPWPPALCNTAACANGQVCNLNKACVAPHYTDNGDGTVTDNGTGLVWQKAVSSEPLIWSNEEMAGGAQTFCANLNLGGYKGWRLPRLAELNSLIELGTDPAIDAAVFPDTPSGWFWSVSETDWNFLSYSQAWIVDFSSGANLSEDFDRTYFVRCVHGNGGTDCSCSDPTSCTDSCGNEGAEATSCHAVQCSANGNGNDSCGQPDTACPMTCACVSPETCTDGCGNTGDTATQCLGARCDSLSDGNDTCGAPDPLCLTGGSDGGS